MKTLETGASKTTAAHDVYLFEACTEQPQSRPHLLELVSCGIWTARKLPSLCLLLFPYGTKHFLVIVFLKMRFLLYVLVICRCAVLTCCAETTD